MPMDKQRPVHTLKTIAKQFDLDYDGNQPDLAITGINTLERARPGELSFLANAKYGHLLATTRASAIIMHPDQRAQCPSQALLSTTPYTAYAKVASLFASTRKPVAGIHPSAIIAEDASIGAGVYIGPMVVVGSASRIDQGVSINAHCYIGDNCHVGAGSHLEARVTLLDNITLGKNVLIHPGAVLGADGFGLAIEQDHWIKVPQLGGVRIGDNTEIGANTTIDCGALEDTVIEHDVHLDNLIQIAHNVHIGAHTAMAGCSAVAGSARIGKWCMIGGNAGILGHLEIVDHVTITAKSLVTHSIRKAGVYSSGTPLEDNRSWRKNAARFKHLDKLARQLKIMQREQHD